MLKIALLGFGVVGSGTAEVITENQDRIRRATGDGIEIKYILDLREFPDSPFADRIVHDYNIILNDPEVTLVAEMMGGSHPAYDFTKAALLAGKSVVTSNKEVVAKFGTELLQIADALGVYYLFEASVGGGIPILRAMAHDLASDRIMSVNGILNGTTNYILTRMVEDGISFEAALSEAQQKGYAERDPSADVDGHDAARKIVILCAMAYGVRYNPDEIPVQGIRTVKVEHVKLAAELGCAIKLIGHTAKDAQGKTQLWVAPCAVPNANPLSHIRDVFNGILTDTDMLGQTMFYGRGAGKLPTAGAVVSDMTDIATHPYDSAIAQHWVDGSVIELSDPALEISDYMVCCEGMATKLAEALGAAHFVGCSECGYSAMIVKNTTRKALDAALTSARACATIYRVVCVM
ncbi:MAG: homoserine dehydrogenase [Clostridia bacterium]|nr:homoserine dehydrogenase [Clostridia bacterium]